VNQTDVPNLLYVEDEEDDVVLLQMAFKRAGLAAAMHVASNGKEALQYLFGTNGNGSATEHPSPQLVLLDLNLPQLSGFEVLQRIRAEPTHAALPVIIFSSSDQQSDKDKAAELGASAYAVKPSRMDDLVRFAESLKRDWLHQP
jgi:CheY-like chemotaxis protein